MKPLRPLLLPLLVLPGLLHAATVESRISAVTVYADRAIVSRTAELDLPQGESALVFDHLPSDLIDQSLQFSGHGAAPATILDVNSERTFVDATPDARVKDLEDQLEALRKQGHVLDDRAGVLNEEQGFVKRMLLSSTAAPSGASDAAHPGGVGPRPSLEEWQKLLAYSDETLGKIVTELRSIDDQRHDLTGKKAALEQQLESLRGARGKSVKSVKVRVTLDAPGKLAVELRYAVPGATWAPSYNARLRSEDRAVDLSYYGLVRNATGEDWKDIALTLSTARPGLGGGAPELLPWVVDVRQEMEEAKSRNVTIAGMRLSERAANAPAGMATQQFLSDSEAQSKDLQVFDIAAVVEANATSATFRISAPVSVPANNSVQKVSIASARLAASLQYESTPKMMEAAFLSAEATNTTDYPLLAGSMNAFLDDTFIAASRLTAVMPGEKFELHLGVDEGISVKRRLVNRFSENTGLTNNGSRVTYDYLLTITNHKRTAERVTFKEPLPVSRQEKIVVTLIQPDEDAVGTKESPKEVMREEGKLVWRLDLKPAEKREIQLKFSISYPADLSVIGIE